MGDSKGAGDAEVEYRIEHDSMGEIRVPQSARWGAQTQRAVENFPISGQTVEPAFLVALAMIKGAAAMVNAEMGTIGADVAAAIAVAAEEVAAGRHLDQIPDRRLPDGVGDLTNMNMNEVLVNFAGARLGREGARTTAQRLSVNQ